MKQPGFRIVLAFCIVCFLVSPTQTLKTCEKIDSCTCQMSDGSGKVNLKGIGIKGGQDSLFTQSGDDGWLYKYNPCYGFYWIYYSDLAVVQTNKAGTSGFDLGNQTSAEFTVTEGGDVTITYTASDGDRTSRVILVCNKQTNDHLLEFVGELIITEYDFILDTPCACPGLCDDNGIINPVEIVTTVKADGVINVNVNNNGGGGDSDDTPSSAFMWTDVGGAMIALLFHDLLLVVLIAGVVALVRYMNCCGQKQGLSSPSSTAAATKGFSPQEVVITTSSAKNNPYENNLSSA